MFLNILTQLHTYYYEKKYFETSCKGEIDILGYLKFGTNKGNIHMYVCISVLKNVRASFSEFLISTTHSNVGDIQPNTETEKSMDLNFYRELYYLSLSVCSSYQFI